MTNQMQKPRDAVGGCLVVAIGAFFLLAAQDLDFGSSRNMGAGYFPTVLSILVMVLGAALAIKSLCGASVEGALGGIPWIGLVGVIGSVVFFGLTLRGLGIGPAVAVLVFATAATSRYARWTVSLVLAGIIAVLCAVLFVLVLGLPLPTVGPWLSTGYWWAGTAIPAR